MSPLVAALAWLGLQQPVVSSLTEVPVVLYDPKAFGFDARSVLGQERSEHFDHGYGDGRVMSLKQSDFEALPPQEAPFCAAVRRAAGADDDLVADICQVFTDDGEVLSVFGELVEGANLWVVPHDREFLWPSLSYGHDRTLSLLEADNEIGLETVTDEPKLFRVKNFVTEEEVDGLIAKALELELQRSTGGLARKGAKGHNKGTFTDRRTSTNAWDTSSPLAMKIKRRTFELLKLKKFDASWFGGLQMVHYDPGQYYHSHQDWFDPQTSGRSGSDFNWDPSTGGVNRFATLFIYLSDTELGGETVFPNAVLPPGWKSDARGTDQQAYNRSDELFERHQALEIEMVGTCRTKLAVIPRKGDAVLFYTQSTLGHLDIQALHGACPVLEGEKWGANLWIWNGQPWNMENAAEEPPNRRYARFQNQFDVAGDLYWINDADELVELETAVRPKTWYESNTWADHRFAFAIDDQIVSSWTITGDSEDQEYVLTPALHLHKHLGLSFKVAHDEL